MHASGDRAATGRMSGTMANSAECGCDARPARLGASGLQAVLWLALVWTFLLVSQGDLTLTRITAVSTETPLRMHFCRLCAGVLVMLSCHMCLRGFCRLRGTVGGCG